MQIFYKLYNKYNAVIYKCDSYEVAVKEYKNISDIVRKISVSAQEEKDVTEYFILDNIQQEIAEDQLLDILKRAKNIYDKWVNL